MKPVVIEFIGAPGTGKSTVASQVIMKIQESGLRCPTRGETAEWRSRCGLSSRNRSGRFAQWIQNRMVLSYLQWLTAYPMTSFVAYRYALSVRPGVREALRRSKAIMAWNALAKRFIDDSTYDVVLLDEGPLQYALAVAATGHTYSTSHLRMVVSKIMQTWQHSVVHLCLDHEVVLERIRDRREESHLLGLKSWRFEHCSIPEQIERAKVACEIVQAIADFAEQQSPGCVVKVDGRQDAECAASYLCRHIDCMLERREGNMNSRV